MILSLVLLAIAAYIAFNAYDSATGFDWNKGVGAFLALLAAGLAYISDLSNFILGW